MEPRTAPAAPHWILLLAFRRVVFALLLGWFATYLLARAVALHNAYVAKDMRFALTADAAGLVAVSVFEIELIYASLKEALPVPDWRSVLGLGPIQQPRLFAIFVACEFAVMFLVEPLLGSVLGFEDQAGLSGGHPLLDILVAVVLAPVGEELFFRGWLWTVLRRQWSAPAVAVATAAPWMLLHLGAGWQVLVILVPIAILLSVARERCGTQATILMHVLNNLVATIGTFLLGAN